MKRVPFMTVADRATHIQSALLGFLHTLTVLDSEGNVWTPFYKHGPSGDLVLCLLAAGGKEKSFGEIDPVAGTYWIVDFTEGEYINFGLAVSAWLESLHLRRVPPPVAEALAAPVAEALVAPAGPVTPPVAPMVAAVPRRGRTVAWLALGAAVAEAARMLLG